jgi:hypothetical protein
MTEEDTMRKTLLFVAVAVLALTTAPTFVTAADLSSQISAAKTAADHEAIADAYAKEAADAEANAAAHDKMAASYKGLGKTGRYHEDQHCAALAKQYREQAKELKELAQAHRDMAKAAK